ncbi:hypothetical protein DFH29DRAFT_406366 [Suillus ampliporus]|nr:hypothetical protein DFH29DRAFT_406366 [Suillus ampliporus]
MDVKMEAISLLSSQSPASQLKAQPPVTKHAANRHASPPRTALQSQRSGIKQKFEPRAFRLIAAYNSITRPRFGQHADRTVDHLEEVYNQLLIDQAVLVDGWITSMEEVGLQSMLTRIHPQPPGSPALHPPEVDAVSDPSQASSRIKARLTSLRQQPAQSQRHFRPP